MRILIVTGEASGDLHGAHLARALRSLNPDVELVGVGGAKMRAAGVTLIHGIEQLGIVGLLGLGQVRAVFRTYRVVSRFLKAERLDAVVFVDNPGLNLERLAPVAKGAGHRVVYYISPQIWAWRPKRINLIRRVVDRMIVILPFELELYRDAGVPCDFVGHPLLDSVAPTFDQAELRKRFGLADASPVIGILPGSRESEVRALLPLLAGAVERLGETRHGTGVVLAQAPSVADGLLLECWPSGQPAPVVVQDQASEVMAAADLLLVASGTATLQAALVGTPMIIVYRAFWLTYWIARALVTVDCIGLVNLVAGRRIVPELLQREATVERIAAEASRLLDDPVAAETMRAELRAVRASLGEPGASRRAAQAILAECVA